MYCLFSINARYKRVYRLYGLYLQHRFDIGHVPMLHGIYWVRPPPKYNNAITPAIIQGLARYICQRWGNKRFSFGLKQPISATNPDSNWPGTHFTRNFEFTVNSCENYFHIWAAVACAKLLPDRSRGRHCWFCYWRVSLGENAPGAQQISERWDHYNIQPRSSETSRDLVVERRSPLWAEARETMTKGIFSMHTSHDITVMSYSRIQGITIHQQLDYLSNSWFWSTPKNQSSALECLCDGNLSVNGGFPSQRANDRESVYIHVHTISLVMGPVRNGPNVADTIFKLFSFFYFVLKSNEACLWGANWQQVSIGSDNGLAPSKRRAILWTTYGLFTDTFIRAPDSVS